MRKLLLLPILLTLLFSIGAEGTAVADLLDREGRSLSWDPYRMVGVLKEDDRRVIFRPGLPLAMGDYTVPLEAEVWVDPAGKVLISDATALRFGAYLEKKADHRGAIISAVIIDAGHGGKDPGAVGNYIVEGENRRYFEKDVTLRVARELGMLIKQDYPDRTILLTREDDKYLTLEERTEIANTIELGEDEAMIFISIHANSSFNTMAKGFEVWYLPPEYRRDLLTERDMEGVSADVLPILNTMREEEFTLESIFLAKEISQGMEEQIGVQSPNRGLKEESWFVVRNAKMPSVLIETGFISNGEEAARLNDQVYLKRMAQGIYNGVQSFIDGFEETKGFTE